MTTPLDYAWWTKYRGDLRQTVSDLVGRILFAGIGSGIDTLPSGVDLLVDWDIVNQDALSFLKSYLSTDRTGDKAFNWLYEVSETDRRRVVEAIDTWIQEGDPLPELEKKLRPLFGKPRAAMIAQTETTRVYAEGNLIAWKASGVVEGKEWRTAVDELVCPICGPLHLKIVELDGAYSFTQEQLDANPELAKAVASLGNSFGAPPAHPNCRCWLVPRVFMVEEQPETDDERRRREFAEETAWLRDRDAVDDPFKNIRPPEGRAPYGMGEEYRLRRRVVKRIETQMKYRTIAEQKLADYRGQRGVRNRWAIDVAQTRVQELNKAISTMMDIAQETAGDWSFKSELIDGIIEYVSSLREMAA